MMRQLTMNLDMLQLQAGDKVEIVGGPFSGLEARVMNILEGGRAVISLYLRNRQVLVELDCDMLTRKP